MILTIDNNDGAGPVDYSAAISADVPLKIDRALNKPSLCSGMLELGMLPVPARRGRVKIAADDGALLFTGYLATEPAGVYAGVATTGSVYRYAFSAVSDEWLLDKQVLPVIGATLNSTAGTALSSFARRIGGSVFLTAGVQNVRPVGVFEPAQTAPWSANAGALASSAYAAYRVLNGALSLQPAGFVTHPLDFDAGVNASGGTIAIGALKTASVRELANDVTLSGEIEPAAYINETFAGDGTTAIFQLTGGPYRVAASKSKLIDDNFSQSVINQQTWAIIDPGSHLTLTAGGLTMTGGSGYDGQTALTALDPVELGGSLLIEAGSVAINPASQGVLCGLYFGPVLTANCLAGYSVRQSSGSTVVSPLINGVEVGSTFPVQVGHLYTLRIRAHSAEVQRVLQTYYATVDGIFESFGGGSVPSALTFVFDLVDLGASSNTPATVLYDGAAFAPIQNTPAACTFAAVNAAQIYGSIGYITVTQDGSLSIVSTLPGGAKQTRLQGIAGEGTDCEVSATGKVTFFAGRIPVAGEYVTFSYRGRQRSVTRVENAASVSREVVDNAPGTARWLGKVLMPSARSTADCESAALAVLSFATSRSAALSGTYAALNLQQQSDVWPGDVLALTQGGIVTAVIVRSVQVERLPSFPEALSYRIGFANDWAEALGLTLSEALAADAVIPPSAQPTTLLASGNVLPNLPQLQIVSATTTALQVDAGQDAPSGGGFEVRRRDNRFGPAIQQDLVLRSPVRSFSIPRDAQVERYYVRMYDASTPPLYSRFSSALFINLPVA